MKRIGIFLYIAEIVGLCLLYTNIPQYSNHLLSFFLVVAFFNVFLFFLSRKTLKLSVNQSLITYTFVLGYLIVFFQRYFDLALGLRAPTDNCFASQGVILKCAIISLVGQSAFFLAYILPKKNILCPNHSHPQRIIDTKTWKWIFVGTVLLFYVFNITKLFAAYTYSQASLTAEGGTWANYSSMLVQITFVLLISYTLRNANVARIKNIKDFYVRLGFPVHIAIFAYIFFFLMIGDRTPLIIMVCVYMGGLCIAVPKKLSSVHLLTAVVVGALVLSILGLSRNGRSDLIGAVEELQNKESSVFPVTDELASSVLTLHYAVEYVPSRYDYTHGAFILRRLISCIPFGDRLFFSLFNLDWRYTSSAFFVTWIIQGDSFTYGNGTSCNADLYIEFGIWGVMIGLFLWGIFCRYLESHVTSYNSIYFYVTYLFTLGYSVYVSRAYLLVFLNYIVFAILVDLIWRLFFGIK